MRNGALALSIASRSRLACSKIRYGRSWSTSGAASYWGGEGEGRENGEAQPDTAYGLNKQVLLVVCLGQPRLCSVSCPSAGTIIMHGHHYRKSQRIDFDHAPLLRPSDPTHDFRLGSLVVSFSSAAKDDRQVQTELGNCVLRRLSHLYGMCVAAGEQVIYGLPSIIRNHLSPGCPHRDSVALPSPPFPVPPTGRPTPPTKAARSLRFRFTSSSEAPALGELPRPRIRPLSMHHSRTHQLSLSLSPFTQAWFQRRSFAYWAPLSLYLLLLQIYHVGRCHNRPRRR